jgi:hypothetical protein
VQLKSLTESAGGAGGPERVARSVAAGAEKFLLRVWRLERSSNAHSEANKKSILFSYLKIRIEFLEFDIIKHAENK